jgi:hypothetical protein
MQPNEQRLKVIDELPSFTSVASVPLNIRSFPSASLPVTANQLTVKLSATIHFTFLPLATLDLLSDFALLLADPLSLLHYKHSKPILSHTI